MFYTYIIYSPSFDKIYIGQTNSLELRLNEHNNGLSKYTKKYSPWTLIYHEAFETRSDAMKREKEFKSHKGRNFIREKLLNGGVRQLPD